MKLIQFIFLWIAFYGGIQLTIPFSYRVKYRHWVIMIQDMQFVLASINFALIINHLLNI